MPFLLRYVYVLTLILLVLGLLAIVTSHMQGQRRVGRVRVESLPGVRSRYFGALALLACIAAAWFGRDQVELVWTLPVAALALCVQLFRPSEQLRVAGEDGVRLGWYSRKLGALDEWRLTGDHLRFRMRGVWRAVDLPSSQQAEYRERLVAAAPDRESAFKV